MTLGGTAITLSDEIIDGLRSQLTGNLVRASDPEYDEA